MKTTFINTLILLLLYGPAHVNAQIPNNGFENWLNMGNYLSPEGWWTTNDSAAGPYYAATQSSDHYPVAIGNYSLRLENNPAILPDWGAAGLAWTGGWNGNNYPVFPVTGHPASLWGYFKFFPQNGDTMEVHVRLYKNGIDVGGGQFKTANTVSAWTGFNAPFSNYTEADSARIMISSCFDNDAPLPHGNSILYVDNLNFDSLISDGITALINENFISVYPDPLHGMLTVDFHSTQQPWQALTLYNAAGAPIVKKIIDGRMQSLQLDVASLAGGLYFLRCENSGGISVVKKIVIVK